MRSLEWMKFAFVFGFDGDGDPDDQGDPGTDDPSDDDGGDEVDETDLPDKVKAILKKERDLRSAAEKKAKLLEKNANAAKAKREAPKTDKVDDKTDDSDKVSPALQAKIEKLSEGFRKSTLQAMVAKNAGNFQDPDDVYRFLDTGEFDYTQDDDDPSQVVWDESEIRAAIKALSKERPYLLKAAGDGKTPDKKPASGPKFAGSGKQTAGTQVDAKMAQRFPALRSAVRAGSNKKE